VSLGRRCLVPTKARHDALNSASSCPTLTSSVSHHHSLRHQANVTILLNKTTPCRAFASTFSDTGKIDIYRACLEEMEVQLLHCGEVRSVHTSSETTVRVGEHLFPDLLPTSIARILIPLSGMNRQKDYVRESNYNRPSFIY
jgi:hypothetical protein